MQARLIQIARSLRSGSAERLIVLRATEQGMANLLKASARMPAPRPTVMPSPPAHTPGDMHIIRQPDGGPAPAALPAAAATQAYAEAAAAAPSPTGATPDRPVDAPPSDRSVAGDPARTLDFRPQPSLANAQLPTVFALSEPRTDLVAANDPRGGADDAAAATAQFGVQATLIVAILLAVLVIAWAIAA